MADDIKNNLLLLNVFDAGASDSEIGCASHGRGKGSLDVVMFILAWTEPLMGPLMLNARVQSCVLEITLQPIETNYPVQSRFNNYVRISISQPSIARSTITIHRWQKMTPLYHPAIITPNVS